MFVYFIMLFTFAIILNPKIKNKVLQFEAAKKYFNNNMKKLFYLILILFIQCKSEKKVNVELPVVKDSTIKIETAQVPVVNKIFQYSFRIIKADSTTFKNNQAKFQIAKSKINKITAIDLIIEKTKKWASIKYNVVGDNPKDRSYYLDKITLETGEVIFTNSQGECGLLAYYPDENIIVSECGHTSDDCYNLSTGKTTTQIGNPEYILESPNKKFRLNGYFPGQECSTYFIQKNIEGVYLKVLEINEVYPYKNVPENFCNMEDLFWTDDYTLNFTLKNYQNNEKGRKEYYQLIIKEA